MLGHNSLLYFWKTGSSQICITLTPLSKASIGDEVDPMKTERESIGIYVLLYLFIFTILSYLLYIEFKKDLE